MCTNMSSGCQICAATGQCSTAFHDGPGKYCGSFYDTSISDNKPCCCPLHATCKVSPTQCMCHVANDRQPTHYYHNNMPQFEYHKTSSLLVPLILILLCICCCCRRRHDGHGHHHRTVSSDRIPIATAFPADTTCPPENPAYHNYGSTN